MDAGATVFELPHAEPLDLQRSGGDLENAEQPLAKWLTWIRVAGREAGERIALSHQPSFAGLQRSLGGQLLADVVEDGEHRRLTTPCNQAERPEQPQQLAIPPPDLNAIIIHATVATQLPRDQPTFIRFGVVVGDELTGSLVDGDTDDLRGPLVDRNDGIVLESADDRRKGAGLEELVIPAAFVRVEWLVRTHKREDGEDSIAPGRIIDAVTSARTTPRIFISYRRDDAAGEAGRLADHLSRRFGAGAVFLDIETIDPGTDFVSVLQATLQQTAAVLVIIGTRWISLRGASGSRRLDDEKDFVRLEVEKALGRGIPVVPVLVQGAPLPSAGELPPSIAALATRQTAVIDHSEFHADAERLCDRLEAMLGGGRTGQGGLRRWWPLLGGIGALVLVLGFATWRTSTSEQPAAPDARPVTDTSKEAGASAEEVRTLLVQAEAQRRRAQFADALTTLASARELAPGASEVRGAQEDVAMEWVRDARLETPEARFGETIKPAMTIIDASLADAAGQRRADLLAHSGWATFLMWRDGNRQLNPTEWYQQALAVEPDNPYANAMLAHWLLFRDGDLSSATKLFDAALRSQRDVTTVRALQWAALGNHRTPEADAERVRVADAMRRESRPLLERQVSALWSPYYFATLSGRDEQRQLLLGALPPDDHITTMRWAFKEYAATDESRQRTIRYYVALLDASAGRTMDAIQELRHLNKEVANNDGSFRDAVRAALKQLQGGRGSRPPA